MPRHPGAYLGRGQPAAHQAVQAVAHDLDGRTGQGSLLYGQALVPGCERGPAQGDPGVGDVVAGTRASEGLQGAGGEFPGAATVAVAQQELGAGMPDLRVLKRLAEAYRELFGFGEAAFGGVAVASGRPGGLTNGIGRLAPGWPCRRRPGPMPGTTGRRVATS